MTDPDRHPGIAPARAALRRGLEEVLAAEIAARGPFRITSRRPSPRSSTYLAEIIRVRFADGSSERLLCKYSGGVEIDPLSPHRGLAHEAAVYETVLRDAPVSLPEVWGSFRDPGTGHVALVMRFYDDGMSSAEACGDGGVTAAVRWLAALHAWAESRVDDPAWRILDRYDDAYYRRWLDRTCDVARPLEAEYPELDRVAAAYRDSIPILAEAPPTLVHGEFTTRNAFWSGGRIMPVDWETAAIGAGEIDLAVYTFDWPMDDLRELEAAYVEARWSGATPAGFAERMQAARLYVSFHWIFSGESGGVRRVRSHLNAILGEAIRWGILPDRSAPGIVRSDRMPPSGGCAAADPPVTVRQIAFDAPDLPQVWARVFAASDVRSITQTLEWQRTWWSVYARGTLLLLAAERNGETVAIAPFFCDSGMVFFAGAGEADWHDILGESRDVDVLSAILEAAMRLAPGFLGFKLHFIPDRSRTGPALAAAAERLGLDCYELDSMVSVEVDIAADPAAVRRAVSRSMRKAENFFRTNGDLVVQWLTTAAEVLPLVPEFVEMHVARWRLKGVESGFLRPQVRTFLERWLVVSAEAGWLRVLRLAWNGRTLGMDLNWHFGTTQHAGQWVFDTSYMSRSPGQILLRQSVLMALDAGMKIYDLGLGDQAYKFRLPSRTVTCPTRGLYPRDATASG